MRTTTTMKTTATTEEWLRRRRRRRKSRRAASARVRRHPKIMGLIQLGAEGKWHFNNDCHCCTATRQIVPLLGSATTTTTATIGPAETAAAAAASLAGRSLVLSPHRQRQKMTEPRPDEPGQTTWSVYTTLTRDQLTVTPHSSH